MSLHQKYMTGFGPQTKQQFQEATNALSQIIQGLQAGTFADAQAFEGL